MPGLNAAYGNDGWLEGGNVARNNRLQRDSDMAGNQGGVNGMFWHRAMTTHAVNLNMKGIGRGHHGAIAQTNFSEGL